MRNPRIYLETSVWNFAFADDAPEKKDVTLKFFKRIEEGEYKIFVSDLVIDEIMRADDERRNIMLRLIDEYKPEILSITDESLELAGEYVSESVLSSENIEDATHAAIATVSEMDALISWNLKHLANLKRMEKINGVNMKQGYYKRLELITPMEVCNEEL